MSATGAEPMVKLFGASWFTTGSIALTFVGKGVQQGDAVTCRGRVKHIEDAEQGGRRVLLDVWMEKEDGARPVIGEASGILSASSD